MHELKLIKSLMEDAIKFGKDNNAKKITKLYLKMGEFSEINGEVLKFYLKENSKDTILEGCAVDIEESPNRELRLLSMDYE